ncbi:hypothetical protein ACFPOA_09805 [Lysobacter niabensis]|uniref:hypothetical protein n=1 Tax=Agrilutibacter niabensis TaxID=380628 RepID=UPI00360F3BF4
MKRGQRPFSGDAGRTWTRRPGTDYTEFNPDVPTLIEGKATAARFYEASLQGGDKGLVSEMINPHVQTYGDTAILTYNFAGMTKGSDGKIHNTFAKSTRIYVKQGGAGKLVHANFAPVITPDATP